jgi:formiminoglutamase
VVLPLLVSVPHGGLVVPPEVRDLCIASAGEIERDSDEGAAEIYAIGDAVQGFVAAEVARAVVDLNRAEDDRRPDGVVKTETCFAVPVYREALDEPLVQRLLDRYYRPYHARLTELAGAGVLLGIDCHTMLAIGPPIGPMAGERRPEVCLGDGGGETCPVEWTRLMAECLEESFGFPIAVNEPFRGGYVVRSHAAELPWMQLELSREPFMSNADKRARVVGALRRFVERGASPTTSS